MVVAGRTADREDKEKIVGGSRENKIGPKYEVVFDTTFVFLPSKGILFEA